MVVIKVSNIDRSKKVGIVAKNLDEFHTKVMKKYNIKNKLLMKDVTYHLSSDGVIIDNNEYFQTLEPQTTVIMVLKEQRQNLRTDFEVLMENIKLWQKDYLNVGQNVQSFINQNNNKIFSAICVALKIKNSIYVGNGEGDGRTMETQNSLQEWFEGLDTNAKTKELYMYKKAQDRFRSYFYKTKDDLYRSEEYREDKNTKSEIDYLISNFKKWLTLYGFLGHIFDRSKFKNFECNVKYYASNTAPEKALADLEADIKEINYTKRMKLQLRNEHSNILEKSLSLFPLDTFSICDEVGMFSCQGAWNKRSCSYNDHNINPYISKEYRILFQTWNLDHQVEKSRSVIPSILKNVKLLTENKAKCLIHPNRPAVHLSQVIYFMELFTMANLRLVHIVCHDKKTHDLQSSGGCLCYECHELELEKIEN